MGEKVVGIIGGMGPEATVDLMMRVLKATPAMDDADHIRLIVDNNPKVPSRIKALLEGTGESPGPCMAEMGRKLEEWGVDFLAIPCNTAHNYYDDVQSAVRIPVLNMIELTSGAIVEHHPGIKTVGVLASTAVLETALYERSLKARGADVIYPQGDLQAGVMTSIRRIKTGHYARDTIASIQAAIDDLVNRHAEAVVIACTELSIIGDRLNLGVRSYDASQILAEAIVRTAKDRC